MTSIKVTMMLFLAVLLLQMNGSRVAGFVIEKCPLFPTSPSTGMLLSSFSSKTQQQQRKQNQMSLLTICTPITSSKPTTTAPRHFARQQQRMLAHCHHPDSANIEIGSTTNKLSQVRNRLRGIFRRKNRNQTFAIFQKTATIATANCTTAERGWYLLLWLFLCWPVRPSRWPWEPWEEAVASREPLWQRTSNYPCLVYSLVFLGDWHSSTRQRSL